MQIFKRQPDYVARSHQGINRSDIDAFNENVIKSVYEKHPQINFEVFNDSSLVDNRFNKIDWVVTSNSRVIGYAESKVRQNYFFPLWLSMSKATALLDQRAKHRHDDLHLNFYWGIVDTRYGNDCIYMLRLWSPTYRYDLSKCKLVWGGTRKKVKSNADQEWCFEIPKQDLIKIPERFYAPID